MKTEDKIFDLILEGFSIDTLGKLTENQVNALHKRVVKEQTSTSKGVFKVKAGSPAELDAQKKGMSYMTYEGEMEEDKSKSKPKNPWAICTASLSDEFGTSERSEWSKSQMKKYERCVMDVKKSMKEGKNPYQPIIENKIMSIVSKHISPKMSKKDFLNTLTEQGTKEKEKVKPKTTPKTPPKRNPFKDPNPNTKEKPRGKSAEKMKSDFIKIIKNIIGK